MTGTGGMAQMQAVSAEEILRLPTIVWWAGNCDDIAGALGASTLFSLWDVMLLPLP